MNPNEARLVLNTVLTILALVALRLVAAAFTPITFDEAYYWMWSKSLAGGYYDHPPMVAFVIRLGTLIAGDTELGVRLVSILLALPMSWAVYQAAAILFGGRRVAATSAILLNVTLMAAVGTMIVTPDAPLLVASSFVLFSLAKVLETGRGAWWLAVGVAAGAALLSKYTALFFGPAILIWLIAVPKLRRWLISPWLYLGGLVAAGDVRAGHPVERRSPLGVLHQADGPRADRGFQAGLHRRTDPDADRVRDAAGVRSSARWGFMRCSSAAPARLPARALVNAMFWTIVAYFVWHSLHARVEANWFAPVYPAFAIAAAVAANLVQWEAREQRTVEFLPALGGADRHLDVCASDRAGQYRRALGLSPRRHRAQRRRRLARNGRRDRSGAGARRRDLRARAGLRHHRLARLLSAEGHLRRAARTSASAGSTCPSPMRRSLPASCFTFTNSANPPLKDNFARVEQGRRGHAQARAACDRDLCARCAGGAEGRRARPLPAAGTGVGRRLPSARARKNNSASLSDRPSRIVL